MAPRQDDLTSWFGECAEPGIRLFWGFAWLQKYVLRSTCRL